MFPGSPGDKLRRSSDEHCWVTTRMIEPPKCIIFTTNAVHKWWTWPSRASGKNYDTCTGSVFSKKLTVWTVHSPLHAKDQDQCYSCSTNSWNFFVFWFSTSHQGRWEWQRWWFDDALAWIQDMVLTIVTEQEEGLVPTFPDAPCHIWDNLLEKNVW